VRVRWNGEWHSPAMLHGWQQSEERATGGSAASSTTARSHPASGSPSAGGPQLGTSNAPSSAPPSWARGYGATWSWRLPPWLPGPPRQTAGVTDTRTSACDPLLPASERPHRASCSNRRDLTRHLLSKHQGCFKCQCTGASQLPDAQPMVTGAWPTGATPPPVGIPWGVLGVSSGRCPTHARLAASKRDDLTWADCGRDHQAGRPPIPEQA